MTTPPNDPNGQDPQGQNPYGQQPPPPPNPYGAPSYPGYGAPGGAPGGAPQATSTDGVSVGALVSSLVCCAPVAVILGFVGLKRTKGGQRKGRGLAIAGLVLGLLGLLAWVAVGIGLAAGVSFLSSYVSLDEAEAGQCVDVTDDDGEVRLREKECTEEHDGEVVHVGTIGDAGAGTELTTAVCFEALSEEDLTAISEAVGGDALSAIQVVTEDPGNPDADDKFVCYVESDEKLTEPIL